MRDWLKDLFREIGQWDWTEIALKSIGHLLFKVIIAIILGQKRNK